MSDGDIHVGDYELRNCVATGNVSQIWEVVERGGTMQFAMKLLLPEAFEESSNKNVLKHEFKVGKSLDHPNVIRFHKLEVNRDHAYFIMDYFRAPSLKSQISSDHLGVQVRFRKLVEAVTLALTHIHEKGWLHRDIKPENILMNRGSEVRVIDFSLSIRQSGAIGKLVGGKVKQVQGTRTYIAPETLAKKKPTVQTDMYSLGITLYEALTGHPPFTGTSPNDLLRKHMLEKPPEPSFSNPNVTAECDQFILRLLKKKPKDRPADMKEVFAEFRNLKVFKEPPEELAERRREEAEREKLLTVDKRLDSRLDAERTAKGIQTPYTPKKQKKAVLLKDLKKAEAAQAAAAANPAPVPPTAYPPPPAPQAPPGYMPQPMYPQPYPQPYPQAYPPQVPYQQVPPGYAPMPGAPMPPPGYPPQQMPPQQMPPGYPPQQMPPGAAPPQSPPPQQPPVQQPPVQQPPVQQPTVQQSPVQQSPAQEEEEERQRQIHRLPLERPQAPAVPKDVPDDIEEFTIEDMMDLDIE